MNHNILHICSINANGLQQLEKRQKAPHPIISIKVDIGLLLWARGAKTHPGT